MKSLFLLIVKKEREHKKAPQFPAGQFKIIY